MFKNRRAWMVGLSMVFFATACDRAPAVPGDPKQRLQDYISRSFAVHGPEDRAALLGHLTGGAKARLAAWSDEQFHQAFMDSKRQFLKLSFREVKPLTPTMVNITYELSYVDQSKGHGAKITNKKLCEMILEQGQWFISDVHNIKELVEYQDEMSLP